jgi:hypothetical protein
MKRTIFKSFLATALLGAGIAACDKDDELTKKQVEVTITVSLPAEHNGISLADVPKDSIAVAIGESSYLTNASGVVSATVAEGLYNLTATATKLVVGLNENSNGVYVLTLLGTANADFSGENATAGINLSVTGSEFTPYGNLASSADTLRLSYRGDTLNLIGIFTPVLEAGDNRVTSITYAIATPARKKETGGSATGAWVDLPYLYSVEGSNLIAADTLFPASFDLTGITGRKREVEPAVLRASLYADATLLAVKDVPVKVDSIDTQLIGIVPTRSVGGDIASRIIPGTNTFTVAAPYATTTGQTISLPNFTGYFSDGSELTTLARRMDANMETGAISYIYHAHIEAENANGTSIPPVSDVKGIANIINTGHPISAGIASNGANAYVNEDNFRVNDPANGATEGETGSFYIFPHKSTRDDFIALHLTVKTVSATGITDLTPEQVELSAQGGAGRRFRYGVNSGSNSVVNASFYVGLTVSEGPTRIYVVAENNGEPLLVLPSTISAYNGNPILQLVTNSAAYQTAALSLDDGVTYIAAQHVSLTDEGKNAPVGTPITFKITPKSNLSTTDGSVIDETKVLQVTTKLYAE